ncbi:MAG: D-glycero-beta-D-manno-heptose-7-phosphate kinase [Ignavibacteriales bacterium]|nr:MAG: D-glycero-beta-D-manno-heptose-7-phosphate kinase [Ignavibacteriales bacterium]
MINLSKQRIAELKEKFKGLHIAVIGDMMLDCYFWGDVKRISPEAPVPIVEVDEEFYRFGGAANVAYNIISLGGIPKPVGVIGYDNNASIFDSLLSEAHISSEGIITDDQRPTTTKTRVIAVKQHIVRIDQEKKNDISTEIEDKILDYLNRNINSLDGIILEDYNKGVLTKRIIEEVINLSLKHDVIITVDPKFNNFFNYKNVTVFKPNKKETEDALGIRIKNEDELKEAGNKLLELLNCKYVLLTMGEKGMAVFRKGKELIHIPTKARKVADVSGAGDTVISTLTMALAAKADIAEAAYIANYAGGLVCEEVGIVPIFSDKLFDEVNEDLK